MNKTINKITKAIKNSPVLAFAIISGLLAVVTPVVSHLSADQTNPIYHNTGINQPTALGNYPAGYNWYASVFNNITNMPKGNSRDAHLKGNYPYGTGSTFDERHFAKVKKSNGGAWHYDNEIFKLQPDTKYTVYMYYHNNGLTNVGAISRDVRAKFALPHFVFKNKPNYAKAYYFYNKYDNRQDKTATPVYVMDALRFTADQRLILEAVPGTIKLHNRAMPNGRVMADKKLFGGGMLVGEQLNGVVEPCREHSGYVTFEFKTKATADFVLPEVQKKVSLSKNGPWSEQVNAKEGDTIYFKISYYIKGKGTADKVRLYEHWSAKRFQILEADLYIGTNGALQSKPTKLTKQDIAKLQNANYYLPYKINVNGKDTATLELHLKGKMVNPTCGVNQNVASMLLFKGPKKAIDQDDAKVNIICEQEPPKKEFTYKCSELNVTPKSHTIFTLSTDIETNDPAKQLIRYEIRDAYNKLYKIEQKHGQFDLRLSKPGVYRIIASVKGDTNSNCQKTVESKKKEQKKETSYSCDYLKVAKEHGAFIFSTDSSAKNTTISKVKYEVRDSNNKLIKTLTGKKDQSVAYEAGDKVGKYSVKAIVFAANDKTGVSSRACEQNFEVEPKQTPKQPVEQVTQLTKTGPAEVLSGIFGLSSVVASLSYYINSRKYI